jgi:eukaryotic-like serine/threonine-protein kinase
VKRDEAKCHYLVKRVGALQDRSVGILFDQAKGPRRLQLGRCGLPSNNLPAVHYICEVFPWDLKMPEPSASVKTPTVSRDLTGMDVGRFHVSSKLGIGGMGEIYRAEDTKLKRTVALKRILHLDERSRKRLLHEAECASRLNEAHIASIYDVVEDGDESFLVMEYVEGQTLRQRMARPFTIKEFLSMAEQCAAALATAHEKRIVHGDIKPENIMLTPGGQVKILDFGVARVLPQQDETVSLGAADSEGNVFGGTPSYMAPEVLLEQPPDGRADIFSLGIVFYEALTGAHPFHGGSFVVTAQRILERTPLPLRKGNPRFPAELERIIAKMLAKDRDQRYATAADLLVDLRALQHPSGERVLPKARAKFLERKITLGGAALIGVCALFLAAVPGARKPFETRFGAIPIPREKLVAVLPFTVLNADAQTTPFSDGLTETLTAKLSELSVTPPLQVIPATDVRAKDVKTADAARSEFGATLVLQGNLQRSRDSLRINATLVDTRTHRQIRAESLTVAASDPFRVQDQIVGAAVQMLGLKVQPQQREELKARGTQLAGAYDFYVQGRGYLQNYDKPENIENAIRVFDRAVELDGRFALAYAGRGQAYWKLYESTKDRSWVEKSREDCERALRLESGNAMAHVCLGALYKGTGQYEAAVTQFEDAIQKDPSSDEAYRELGEAYAELGRIAKAEETYRRAIELRPHYWGGYNWLGVFYYGRAQYKEAAQMFEQVAALAPDNARGLSNLGASYVSQARYADAIPVLQRSISIRPSGGAYSNLGNSYFYLGRYDDATSAYKQAVELRPKDFRLWRNLGDGYYWSSGKKELTADAYRHAVSVVDEQLRLNSKDGDAVGIAAVSKAMLGDKKAAFESLRAALKLNPDDPETFFRAALVHNHFGDRQQALDWLKKALAGGISAQMVRDTPDFNPLRSDSGFQELIRAK